MRETSPAWNLPGTDLHFVTRYDLATTILRDTATFSSAYGATANEPPAPHLVERLEAIRRQGWDRPPTMLTVDPPDHTRYRQTVSKAFNARAIGALRPAVEAIVDDEIDSFIDDGVVNFKTVFATPVPVRVIVEALNLSPGHEADIKRWSDDTTASIGARLDDERLIEAQHGILGLQRFMHAELEERRREPRDDIVTALVSAELPLPDEQGTRPLTMEELLGILQQLIGAGNETTTKLFSQMLRMLAEEHDEWSRLKNDLSRAAAGRRRGPPARQPDAGPLSQGHPGRRARRHADPCRRSRAGHVRRREPRPCRVPRSGPLRSRSTERARPHRLRLRRALLHRRPARPPRERHRDPASSPSGGRTSA